MTTLPAVIDWDNEMKGATMLVRSGLVPEDIKKPEAALFVIMAGRDMGLSPVQSLRSIRIIKGKLELSADVQLGKFHEAGGKSQWLELTDDSVRLKLVAPWTIEPHVSTFTLADAKRAQLLSNPSWTKYPKAMLRSRAITQGLKDVGFLLGSQVYAPGEVGGDVRVDATGEVLPGETTMAERVIEAEIQPLAGEVEDDGGLTLTVQLIREALSKDNVAGAFNVYSTLDNADAKVSVWRMLEKDERKAIKTFGEAQRKSQIVVEQPAVTTEVAPEIDIKDVRAHIVAGDLDLAADIARSIRDDIIRAEAEKEVMAAHAHQQRVASGK